MTTRRWALAPILTLIVAMAIACSGDSNDDGPAGAATDVPASPAIGASSTGSGSAASDAPTAVAEAPTAEAAPSESPLPTTAPNNQDSQAASSSLDSLQSYRFDVAMMMDIEGLDFESDEEAAMAAMMLGMLGNIQMEGAYVAPDRYTFSTNLFGMDLQSVQIGDQAWSNDGTGWTLDASAMGGPIGGFSPADLPMDMIPQELLPGAEVGDETVNGVETTHYSFDKESLAELAALAGETTGMEDLDEVDSMDLDLWLTEDGVPVKMTMAIEGQTEEGTISISMEYNIKDLNDPGITIEAPI